MGGQQSMSYNAAQLTTHRVNMLSQLTADNHIKHAIDWTHKESDRVYSVQQKSTVNDEATEATVISS